MVHKEKYQMLADGAAAVCGGYASHIGKIGEETFVYSILSGNSADSDPDGPTVLTVHGDDVAVHRGADALAVLAETNRREFSTGRAIYKKYQVLVRNGSAVIGEGPGYAQSIVDAVASKAVKPSLLYQYLEVAEHYRKKLRFSGSDILLI